MYRLGSERRGCTPNGRTRNAAGVPEAFSECGSGTLLTKFREKMARMWVGKRIVNMGFPPPNHRLSPQAWFSRTHIGHKPLNNLAEETTFRANQAQTSHKPCTNLAQTLHKPCTPCTNQAQLAQTDPRPRYCTTAVMHGPRRAPLGLAASRDSSGSSTSH